MPTGHTADIAKGMTFEKFIWSCARSFGALVTMRDDPSDAPIPQKLIPSDYCLKESKRATKELEKVKKMTVEQCETEAKIEAAEERESTEESIAEAESLKIKYEAMLEKVMAWQPPSPEHVHLKEFMIEQIKSSIEHDCDAKYYRNKLKTLKTQTAEQWKESKIKMLEHDITYYTKEYKEEVERTNGRNEWIQQLRESLKKK